MGSKTIYFFYFIGTTLGVFLALRAIWALATHRAVRWKALAVFTTLVGVITLYYLWQTSLGLDAMADARREYARSAQTTIRIAIPWIEKQDDFFNGAKRAAQEINADPVKVVLPDGSSKQLTLDVVSFPYKPGEALDVAQKIAQDPSIAGVIGHPDVDGAIQASATYDAAGLLYFAPTIRQVQLTEHRFSTVFRLSPSDADMARAVADFANSNGLFNIAIVSPRNDYGYDLFQIYKGEISALSTSQHMADAPHMRRFVSYAPELNRFDEIINSIIDGSSGQMQQIDLVVILGTSPSEAHLLEQMRRRTLRAAILCLPDLQGEAMALVKATPDSMAGPIYVLNDGDLNLKNGSAGRSESASRESLAYNAVKLMADAWRRTGTTESRDVAISLRATPDWHLGNLRLDFRSSGGVKSRPIGVEKIDPALGGQPQLVFESRPAVSQLATSQP